MGFRLALVCSAIVLLSISGLSHAGVTSSYTRVAEPSEEMPLETFPPPAGLNAPEQVLSNLSILNQLVLLLLRLTKTLSPFSGSYNAGRSQRSRYDNLVGDADKR